MVVVCAFFHHSLWFRQPKFWMNWQFHYGMGINYLWLVWSAACDICLFNTREPKTIQIYSIVNLGPLTRTDSNAAFQVNSTQECRYFNIILGSSSVQSTLMGIKWKGNHLFNFLAWTWSRFWILAQNICCLLFRLHHNSLLSHRSCSLI